MNDKIKSALESAHAKAYADELVKRAELFDAVGVAFQNREEAVGNFEWALGHWGTSRIIDIVETQPSRFGKPSGAWYTLDGWTLGGKARSDASESALARIPDLIRELEQAETRERASRDAYQRYCRENRIDPERPWQYDPRSRGATQTPEHLAPDREPESRRQTPRRAEPSDRAPAPDNTRQQPPEALQRAQPEREDHLDWMREPVPAPDQRDRDMTPGHEPQRAPEDHLDWMRGELERESSDREQEPERERER
ncbi:hypothetical protein FM996_02225 [Methylosinus sporium]|uniref:Uncharacterized protein n=1 Tax=Methylosinus sporium TaxID=428 RepID=A0A549T6U0_METSR|nr:hypothetical protein [Methylosinus sporium]TRL37598.1 hypothetical protein FM996_02225 [Methylosinus sporium]